MATEESPQSVEVSSADASAETSPSFAAVSADPSKKSKKDRLNLDAFLGKSKIGSWAAVADEYPEDDTAAVTPTHKYSSISSVGTNPPSLELPPSRVSSEPHQTSTWRPPRSQTKGKGADQEIKSPKKSGKKGPSSPQINASPKGPSSPQYLILEDLPQNTRVSNILAFLMSLGVKIPKDSVHVAPSSNGQGCVSYVILSEYDEQKRLSGKLDTTQLGPSVTYSISSQKPADFPDRTGAFDTGKKDAPLRDAPSNRARGHVQQDTRFANKASPNMNSSNSLQSPRSHSSRSDAPPNSSERPRLALKPRSVADPVGGLCDAYKEKANPFGSARPIELVASPPQNGNQASSTNQTQTQTQTQSQSQTITQTISQTQSTAKENSTSSAARRNTTEPLDVVIRLTPTSSPSLHATTAPPS
eukprot:TRINITY_DN1728_c0_g3_i1.p1 TRINITY_DN1728_c0_g3~~TRINITY_DN1728_c0_g3_i1.p1  ORF type:complete len:416 (-),score=93.54 TRINITY_DN1728_c0_g3_i1:180-1427(-)